MPFYGATYGLLLGLYRGIQGLYRNIFMAKKLETTI